MAHEFQRVINVLDRADEAAAGGKQRELLEYAIRLLTREYLDGMYEAGNCYLDSGREIQDLAKQEAAYRYTGK